MSDLVRYELADGVAHIAMDDGKANALSPQMFVALNEAFDRADDDDAAIVLSGRDGRFSGGFDLATLTSGGDATLGLLRSGFDLSARMMSRRRPVVAACTGHAIAMGVFLLLSADYRVGASGEFKIVANEVALGMTMPHAAIVVLRQRLSPAHLHRATLLSEVYSPASAIDAGFLDRIVPPDEVVAEAIAAAKTFSALNVNAHAESKARLREPVLVALHEAIERDQSELRSAFSGS